MATASTSAAAAAATTSTSAFVPGPGQTSDDPAGGGFPLRTVLLATGLGLLGGASVMSVQLLRRRGNHS